MSQTLTKGDLKTYSFTLVFAGEFDDLSDQVVDAIREAGCEDSHILLREGVLRISFDRQAPSYRVALYSAIADLEKTGLDLELERVESE